MQIADVNKRYLTKHIEGRKQKVYNGQVAEDVYQFSHKGFGWFEKLVIMVTKIEFFLISFIPYP